MAGGLRQRALSKVFGDGATGFVAASALSWIVEQLRDSRDNAGVLETARLIPGETYIVRTRPPMGRSERRMAERLERASTALARMEQPSAKQRRVALRLRKAQRRVDHRPGDAGRALAAQRLGERFDKVMAPSSRHQRLIDEVATLTRQLDERRDVAVAAMGRRRPSRTRRYF